MHSFIRHGKQSVTLRFELYDSTSSTGARLLGLTSASSGLQICVIASNEAAGAVYTVASSTIESITTCGTFATPTSGKCRFKFVDATYHPGLYEFQFVNARFAVGSAESVHITVKGATDLAQQDVLIQLNVDDPQTAKLTVRDNLQLDEGTAQSHAADSIQLRAGAPVHPVGSRIYIETAATAGALQESNVTAWVNGTKTATVDPPWPTPLVGTVTYRSFAGSAAPVTNKIDVDISAESRVILVDEIWDEVITTGHAVANSAAVKLVAPVGVELSTASRGLIVDEVWDEVITVGHLVANSAAVKLAASGAAADPLANLVPGTYLVGTAGHALGSRLDVAVSSRAAESGGNLTTVKNKTDQMSFGVANTQNVNVTHVNEVLLTGDGITTGMGTP